MSVNSSLVSLASCVVVISGWRLCVLMGWVKRDDALHIIQPRSLSCGAIIG